MKKTIIAVVLLVGISCSGVNSPRYPPITFLYDNIFIADPIKVALESVKDEYVIKEPVRFKETLTNVSVFEQRIMPVDKWYMTLKRHRNSNIHWNTLVCAMLLIL